MDEQKLNTKPDIHTLTSGNPLPGSYVIRDGKVMPNLNDEAMANRNKIKDESKKIKVENEKPLNTEN